MPDRDLYRLNAIYSQLMTLTYTHELDAVMKAFGVASWYEKDRLLHDLYTARQNGTYSGLPIDLITKELHIKHPLYVMFRPNIRHKHKGFKAVLIWTFLLLLAVFGEKGINKVEPTFRTVAPIALAVVAYACIVYSMYILVLLVNGNLFNP
jgi:hypothetical protein